jgi:hypothetical protein
VIKVLLLEAGAVAGPVGAMLAWRYIMKRYAPDHWAEWQVGRERARAKHRREMHWWQH